MECRRGTDGGLLRDLCAAGLVLGGGCAWGELGGGLAVALGASEININNKKAIFFQLSRSIELEPTSDAWRHLGPCDQT